VPQASWPSASCCKSLCPSIPVAPITRIFKTDFSAAEPSGTRFGGRVGFPVDGPTWARRHYKRTARGPYNAEICAEVKRRSRRSLGDLANLVESIQEYPTCSP
jgi:hypothetical protein